MAPDDSIERRILAFLRDEILTPDVTVGRDDELLSSEILDSVAMVRLASFVEAEFHFKMEPSDFVIENFRSVGSLAELVRRASER